MNETVTKHNVVAKTVKWEWTKNKTCLAEGGGGVIWTRHKQIVPDEIMFVLDNSLETFHVTRAYSRWAYISVG